MIPRSRLIRLYLLTSGGAFLWIAAIVAAPYLRSRGLDQAGWFYACFAPLCHQISDRSFFLWGFPLAVCARCFGIYTGFAAGLMIYPFRRGFDTARIPRLKMFLLVSAPIVLDTGGNFLRLWETGHLLRFLTGYLWGSLLPFYFLTGLAEWPAPFRASPTASSDPPDPPRPDQASGRR
jgi:uncharacterized membrane protein